MRLSVILAVLFVVACSSGPKPSASGSLACQGSACPCARDADCEAACTSAACSCVAGTCHPQACSSDAECVDSICTAGDCVQPAALSGVASCTILPRHPLLRDGDRLPITTLTLDPAGAAIRVGQQPTLTVTGAGATVDGATLVGGSAAGTFTVNASLGAATCATDGVALGTSVAQLRVVVVDELTGLPLPGATVQVESTPAPVVSLTGADGAALFPTAPPAPRTVSVFLADHGYLTVDAVSGDDLVLPVRRAPPADAHLGIQGSFGPADLFDSEGLQVGLAGTSIPGSLLDLSLPVIAGPNLDVTIRFGVPTLVQIPSGLVFGLGRTWFKPSYQATVDPGLCADPARDASGSCALRTAWGLAGSVPLSRIPIELFTGAPPDPGKLLAELLPSFAGFRSAVRRGVAIDAVPDVGGEPDASAFTQVDLQATQPLRLGSPLTLPELPSGTRPLRSVVALAGVREPGGSMVLLGMDAALDESPQDGVIDGTIALRHAAAHDGLEGGDWVVMALALDLDADGSPCNTADTSGCMAVSGLFHTAASLPDGSAVALDGPFLGLATESTWDEASRSLDPGAIAGAPTFQRVLLAAPGGTWAVFAPAGGAVRVPAPPAGFNDPLGSATRLTVQAVRSSADLDTLAAGRSAFLADLLGVAQAFSSLDRPP